MADIFCYADYENSVTIYDTLKRLGKLCAIPGCTQHKAYLNGSRFCYAHQKERDGLIRLDDTTTSN